jgi:hypothetical protein
MEIIVDKIKPRVFIASSVEALPIADAINANLDHDTFPTLWRTGTFRIGSNSIDDLVKKSSAVDFAIFVFTPDDAATIREEAAQVVRDNVLFELGLFIGSLGKERCYVVRPRGEEMHLPSDLLGITTADYVSNRPDGDLASALNAACKLIKDEITRHGPISTNLRASEANCRRHIANPPDYKLNLTDLRFLAECADSHTTYPRGLGFYDIAGRLKGEPDNVVRLSAVKLTKLGYLEKTIETDRQDGEQYYAFSITDDGLELYLKNEQTYRETAKTNKSTAAPNFSDMDDKIPF